jgi:hypothetical protein
MGDYASPHPPAFSYCVSAAKKPSLEDAMASQPIARRIQPASEFTCSRCGGHEAYVCPSQNLFLRYALRPLMVQPARCCDCDALCYAFPARLSAPVQHGVQRTALVSQSRVSQLRVSQTQLRVSQTKTPPSVSAPIAARREPKNPPPISSQILSARTAPTPARSFRPVSGWTIGAGA